MILFKWKYSYYGRRREIMGGERNVMEGKGETKGGERETLW
jgi:hypothetical protein